MKSAVENRATHIVTGNVLDALGFSASEADVLKVKAVILSEILEHVRADGYTQAQLADLLDKDLPSVRNLLKGRIASVSIETLILYGDRLQLETIVEARRRRTKKPFRP